MSIQVLVVDDNRDALRSYARALRRIRTPDRKTMRVKDADSVSTATDQLRSEAYDILVVDLKIPGVSGTEMGGFELIAESMHVDPLRPIIVITGYGTIELAKKALAQGVFDFIEKSPTATGELVKAVERAMSSIEDRVLRSGNPFVTMTGVDPNVFGGRTAEVEFFDQRLTRAIQTRYREHFLVQGEWGIGKSTLLREYKKICQARGYIASVVPLGPAQSNQRLVDVARSIVEGILRNLPFPVPRFRKVADYFGSVGISVLGTGIQFGRSTAGSEISAQAFLHDTLLNLWDDLREETDALVVLLDDIDNVLSVPEILMTLRQTLAMESIQNAGVLFGLAGTPRGWQSLTAVEKHHPVSRYFMSRVQLGPLAESEVRETVRKSLVGTGVSFTEDVVDRVVEVTGGHPFEMQVVCYRLFESQISRRVTQDLWEKAFQSALNDLGLAVFDQWLGQASNEEFKVLRAVAALGPEATTSDIQQQVPVGKHRTAPQSISKYLQRLVQKQLVERRSRGVYSVPDPMFRAYIGTRADRE